jgi:hypothetical protein
LWVVFMNPLAFFALLIDTLSKNHLYASVCRTDFAWRASQVPVCGGDLPKTTWL